MDPFSIATGVVGVVAALLAFGGAGCSLADSVSASVQELRHFAEEIEQFGIIWKEAETQIKIKRSEVGVEFETKFLTFTERTTHLLDEAHRELRQFQRFDKDYSRRQLQRERTFAAFRPVTVWRSREERIHAYLKRATIRVQRSRLETAKSSLSQWILLLGLARRAPSPQEVNRIHELHVQHSRAKMRQEIEEERAGQDHVEVSLPVNTLARRCSPPLSASLESLESLERPRPRANSSQRGRKQKAESRERDHRGSRSRVAYETAFQLQNERDQANEQRQTAEKNWGKYYTAYEKTAEEYRNLHDLYVALLAEQSRIEEENRTLREHYDDATERYQVLYTEVATARATLEQQLESSQNQHAMVVNTAQARESELQAHLTEQTETANGLRIRLTHVEKLLEEAQTELGRIKTRHMPSEDEFAQVRNLSSQLDEHRRIITSLERRNEALVQQSIHMREQRDSLAQEARQRDANRGRNRQSSARPDSGYEPGRYTPQRSRSVSVKRRPKVDDDRRPTRNARTRQQYVYVKRDPTSHRKGERKKKSTFSQLMRYLIG